MKSGRERTTRNNLSCTLLRSVTIHTVVGAAEFLNGGQHLLQLEKNGFACAKKCVNVISTLTQSNVVADLQTGGTEEKVIGRSKYK